MISMMNSERTVHDLTALRERSMKLKMRAAAFYIPSDKSEKPQGDDAHFICANKKTIGVADGVGGWAKKGVDAGEYARQLMANSINAIQNEPKGAVDPRGVLIEAHAKTNIEGSSTACIITLTDHCLHAANLGDSGFLVIRNGENVYQSPVQVHSFNYPYQLGNGESCDHPTLAQVFKIAVKPGDVIVAGTDGLFDNMFAKQIEDIAKMGIKEGVTPEEMAWAIAEHAYNNSLDANAPTPFMEAAMRDGKQHYGGKIDDITVVVAYII